MASLDENQEPIPVRIATMREGQLVPVVEQEEIDELFRAIDRERTARKSCQYTLLIIIRGGFVLDIVLNSTQCL